MNLSERLEERANTFNISGMYKIFTCLIARPMGSNFVVQKRVGLKEKNSLTKNRLIARLTRFH